jgi:hypothetical protein
MTQFDKVHTILYPLTDSLRAGDLKKIYTVYGKGSESCMFCHTIFHIQNLIAEILRMTRLPLASSAIFPPS